MEQEESLGLNWRRGEDAKVKARQGGNDALKVEIQRGVRSVVVQFRAVKKVGCTGAAASRPGASTGRQVHQKASDLLRSVDEALSSARNSWNDSCPSPSASYAASVWLTICSSCALLRPRRLVAASWRSRSARETKPSSSAS